MAIAINARILVNKSDLADQWIANDDATIERIVKARLHDTLPEGWNPETLSVTVERKVSRKQELAALKGEPTTNADTEGFTS